MLMNSPQINTAIRLAHPGKRFQGQFIDGLVSYLLGIMAFYFSDLMMNREYSVYFAYAVGLVYFLFSDALPNGQSVGKKLLNIRVINKETMRSCSILESLLRNITFPLGIVDWAFIFFGSHRRLGDFIASTIVVKNDWNQPNSFIKLVTHFHIPLRAYPFTVRRMIAISYSLN